VSDLLQETLGNVR